MNSDPVLLVRSAKIVKLLPTDQMNFCQEFVNSEQPEFTNFITDIQLNVSKKQLVNMVQQAPQIHKVRYSN
jgi:hypothetical protein